MATTTTRLGLIEPATTDAPSEIRIAIVNNATTLDSAALYLSGTLASRPAASAVVAGTFYDATDTGILSKSNHTAWVNVAQLDSGGHVPLAELSGITHSQLATSAGILGSQLDPAAGIVDAQITHGAWTTVTPASGFSGTTGNYLPQARVEGDRVYLRGALQNVSGIVITVGNNVFNLPAGMAPAKNVVLMAPRSDGAISVLGISGGAAVCSILGSAVSVGVNLDFDDQFFPLTV